MKDHAPQKMCAGNSRKTNSENYTLDLVIGSFGEEDLTTLREERYDRKANVMSAIVVAGHPE